MAVQLGTFAGPVVAAAIVVAAVAAVGRAPAPPDDPPGPVDRGVDELIGVVMARNLVHEVVAHEVVDGRLSMSAAAAIYAWLNALDPPVSPHWFAPQSWDDPTPSWAGWTPAEVAYLHAMRRVTRSLETEVAARMCPDLNAEFEAGRSCGRPLTLPAVSEAGCGRLLAWAISADEAAREGRPTPWRSHPAVSKLVTDAVRQVK